jgi:hypothetical protein
MMGLANTEQKCLEWRETLPRRMRPPACAQRFLLELLRELFRAPLREDDLRAPFRDGTLAPFRLASFNPIAMACFRLFTDRPDPLLSVPFFFRRIADSTLFDADFPYFAMHTPPRHRLQGVC